MVYSLISIETGRAVTPLNSGLPILALAVSAAHTTIKKEENMRIATRKIGFAVVAMLACLAHTMHAQDDAKKAALEQVLKTQYHWTAITADRSDIVTPGDVLVLHKDGLVMCGVEAKFALTNTYKNGSLSSNQMSWALSLGLAGVSSSIIPQRKFVAGEKFWIVGYGVLKDGVALEVYSDPYNDIRYYGLLKIPFAKNSIPSPDDVLKSLAEVVTIQPAETTAPTAPPPTPAAPPPDQPAATIEPLAPPPPPADAPPVAPPTVTLGQTKDQVIAILGPPKKIASVGTKETYYYSDMKVILVNGKVTDIQ